MWIKVYAPASIGNIGPGFDTLGMAVNSNGDIVEARIKDTPGVIISYLESKAEIPKDAKKNTAGIAAIEVLKKLKSNKGIELRLFKGLPIASGLGSSAASAVAAGFAVNRLLGDKLNQMELLDCITIAEKAVSGAYFVDNTGSSLMGGVILTKSLDPLEVYHFTQIPDNLFIILATPNYAVLTKKAREVIPKQVELKDSLKNIANCCTIIAALYRNDATLFGKAIDDQLIEKFRAPLIPGFYDVKQAAIKAGALGCSISGAGPTVFAVLDNKENADRIANNMEQAFLKNNLISETIVTSINREGAFQIK